MDQDEWEDFEQGQVDPRKDEDWKIQKRKGFLKDKESKVQQVQQWLSQQRKLKSLN